ncbi:MAG TPA: periplasmic heavy metal sensor [Holophagaceae bacterium]|nr:periplasmic heavy metal sensor [Holophagaceae bacterium]
MLILFPPAAVQGPPQPPPPPPLELPLLRFAQELALSDDQALRLHALMDQHRDAMETKGLALHQAHRAVHEALREPGTTAAQLDALLRTASQRESEFLQEARVLNAACWEVLTPAQREKAKALMARPPRGGEGPHGRPGMGHPMGRGMEPGSGGLPPGPPPDGD